MKTVFRATNLAFSLAAATAFVDSTIGLVSAQPYSFTMRSILLPTAPLLAAGVLNFGICFLVFRRSSLESRSRI